MAISAKEQFTFHGTAASLTGLTRVTQAPVFLAGAASDFTVTVGPPSAQWLSATGSLSYPLTVQSINGEAGYVNLSVSGLPAGVGYQFMPPQVYIGSGGTAYSTLVLTGSANMPGGTSAVTITGALAGVQRTTTVSLGTQVTTFQVTSVTGSGIVQNNGQQTTVTEAVPNNNAPTFTSCTGPDGSGVTCAVVSSSSGSLTLAITAATSVPGGTVVLMSGGTSGDRTTTHLFVTGGNAMLNPISPGSVPADGQRHQVTLSGWFPNCTEEEFCMPSVTVDPPLISADILDASEDEIVAEFEADTPGTMSISVDVCDTAVEEGSNASCVTNSEPFEVVAPPPPPPPTVAMQLTLVGTVISTDGNYSEDRRVSSTLRHPA